MTPSRLVAAATQMTIEETVSSAIHSEVFLRRMPVPATTLSTSGLGDWLRICLFAYPDARLKYGTAENY